MPLFHRVNLDEYILSDIELTKAKWSSVTLNREPIIRCKDCKYGFKRDDGKYLCKYGTGHEHPENHYCGYAERK